jgi:hypothetical protein
MNPWRKPRVALALILIPAVLIVIFPLSSLAAPQGLLGTPVFLPVVLRNFPQTPTNRHPHPVDRPDHRWPSGWDQ